ncbi:pseudouridine synthase [soil metagenome]
MSEPIRIQKFLSSAGVASRRRCEDLMTSGRVEIDGEVVTQLGARLDPETAVVRVDGKRILPPRQQAYVVLNKPRGIVCSMADEQGRPDLTSLLASRPERLFHVGRLDTDTSGLLLLTNDGEFAHRLAHPSFEVTKTYVALVEGTVRPNTGESLKRGIELEDGPVSVDRFVIKDSNGGKSLVELDIHVGRNRIVRRMMAELGHPVVELTRSSFGNMHLGNLKSGGLRDLTPAELGELFDSVGL